MIEANFYSGTLADTYGLDVLDLHFLFRFSLQHRESDGTHWNALAHRKITSLLLHHAAQAWGVIMNCTVAAVGEEPMHTAITEWWFSMCKDCSKNTDSAVGKCIANYVKGFL